MEHNKIRVIDKGTGEYVFIDIDNAIENEKNYIFLESSYNHTLYELWDFYKKPFIAEHINGFFALIYTDPDAQQKKYNGNVYGRLSKSIKYLILHDKSQQVYFAWEQSWRFIALYK